MIGCSRHISAERNCASFADLKGETVGAQVGTFYVEP